MRFGALVGGLVVGGWSIMMWRGEKVRAIIVGFFGIGCVFLGAVRPGVKRAVYVRVNVGV